MLGVRYYQQQKNYARSGTMTWRVELLSTFVKIGHSCTVRIANYERGESDLSRTFMFVKDHFLLVHNWQFQQLHLLVFLLYFHRHDESDHGCIITEYCLLTQVDNLRCCLWNFSQFTHKPKRSTSFRSDFHSTRDRTSSISTSSLLEAPFLSRNCSVRKVQINTRQ